MPRLIINADDLGVNSQRSHGIFQCIEFGIVTSASIIPNGTDSDTAAKHARERKVSAGLHVNLTEDYPLSRPEDISSLIDSTGKFFDREHLPDMLTDGEVERVHVEREVRAQVEWIFDTYGAPTHVDSHHHIHLHPLVADVLIAILDRYGIRAVRIPLEEPLPPFGYEVSDEQLANVERLNASARAAREIYTANGILTTDHFRGSTLAGNASLKNLRHILNRFPEGTTELMVHPSSAITYGTPFDLDPQRQTELRMLMDDTIPQLLREKKIELIGWGEIG